MITTNLTKLYSQSIKLLAILTISASILCFAGCGPQMLTSRPVDRTFVIDGADTEWGNFIQHYDDVTRTSFCFFNDEDNLYIKMSTTNPATVRSLMALGLTVWLGKEKPDARRWGIVYPLPIAKGERPPKHSDDEPDSLKTDKRLSKLMILVPEQGDTLSMTTSDLTEYGIEISTKDSTPELVYELKVPMRSTEGTPYAALAAGDTEIGIGFQSGEINSDEMRQLISRDDMDASDMAKEVGENSTRRRRVSRPRDFGRDPDPIDVWFSISPAKPDN